MAPDSLRKPPSREYQFASMSRASSPYPHQHLASPVFKTQSQSGMSEMALFAFICAVPCANQPQTRCAALGKPPEQSVPRSPHLCNGRTGISQVYTSLRGVCAWKAPRSGPRAEHWENVRPSRRPSERVRGGRSRQLAQRGWFVSLTHSSDPEAMLFICEQRWVL